MSDYGTFQSEQMHTQSYMNEQMEELNVMVNAGGNVPINESPNCYKAAKDVVGAVVPRIA